MSSCVEHQGTHSHTHSERCQHKRIRHGDHFGYLHDGHLHCTHNGHIDDHSLSHKIPPSAASANCSLGQDCKCKSHDSLHHHGNNCGHPSVPHGDHHDYLVDGHLHHFHGNHCHHHGEIHEQCSTHADHPHQHGPGCGHTAVLHEGHVGYLHHGHLHCLHDNHVDEHVVEISSINPSVCDHGAEVKKGSCHGNGAHQHGENCGHPSVPHGDHVDYLVNGHLHHHHGDHCDHHGPLEVSAELHCRHEGHVHGEGCGHLKIWHDGHVDFLHDGHLHHASTEKEGSYEEHRLEVSGENPAGCTPGHVTCGGHGEGHVHGKGCGHEKVAHGDHFDYVVDGHLHHPHLSHCDHHGPISLSVQ